MGIVIGKRGETLDALQHLTSLVVNRGDKSFLKVSIDAENYREKRNVALEELAGKLHWRFGPDAQSLDLPEGHRVIASCSL